MPSNFNQLQKELIRTVQWFDSLPSNSGGRFSLGSQKYQSLGWWCLLLGNRDNAYGIPTNINVHQISKNKRATYPDWYKNPKGCDLYRSFQGRIIIWWSIFGPSSSIDTSDFQVNLSTPGFHPSPKSQVPAEVRITHRFRSNQPVRISNFSLHSEGVSQGILVSFCHKLWIWV